MPFCLPRPHSEPVVLDLRPLPLGFQQLLKRHGIIAPAPPMRLARDSSGKPVKDSHGQPIRLIDEANETYQNECELYHQRIAVLAVAFALRHDPTSPLAGCWPGSQQPPAGEWTAWADQLFETLVSAGWLAGDLLATCTEITRLSNLISDRLVAAQASFSDSGSSTG